MHNCPNLFACPFGNERRLWSHDEHLTFFFFFKHSKLAHLYRFILFYSITIFRVFTNIRNPVGIKRIANRLLGLLQRLETYTGTATFVAHHSTSVRLYLQIVHRPYIRKYIYY